MLPGWLDACPREALAARAYPWLPGVIPSGIRLQLRRNWATLLAPGTVERVAFVVTNGEDAHSICEDAVADGIREAFQVCFPTTQGSQGECLWIRRDQSQDSFDFLEELIAQPIFALIIPLASLLDLLLDGLVIGEIHALRLAAKWAMNC